jgi:hypothetical protein
VGIRRWRRSTGVYAGNKRKQNANSEKIKASGLQGEHSVTLSKSSPIILSWNQHMTKAAYAAY